jgi:hypothetical protein
MNYRILANSASRPGWLQNDFHAYRHLLCPPKRKGEPVIKHRHFEQTKGFATIDDLHYFTDEGNENGR